jgi:hypothetical protein
LKDNSCCDCSQPLPSSKIDVPNVETNEK